MAKKLTTPSSVLDNFPRTVVDELQSYLPNDKLTTSKRESMWQQFHQYRLQDALQEQWEGVLAKNNATGSHRATMILLQFVLRNTLEAIIQFAGQQTEFLRPMAVKQVDLTESELDACRYVAGFVAFALVKYYQRFKTNSVCCALVDILQQWRTEHKDCGETLYEYTKHWADLVDRGGLFHIHEGVYSFFVALEGEAKKVLSISAIASCKGVNIREMLLKKFEDNLVIDSHWSSLMKCVDNTLKDILFRKVLYKYTELRCRSFVKSYLLVLHKNKAKIAKRGEKCLRKDIIN